ncbi:MAG: GerMN domain-containing protein [Bacillota bacterium]|nr:GerMN domain-containing protein [Bacillota bacterium]
MKRIQPFYYIISLAMLFILAGFVLYIIQFLPRAESSSLAIDPQSADQGEALYDLWFTSTSILDLTVDYGLNGILFSTGNNSVSLLDRERRLLWDRSFATAPGQAKISQCGNYAVIGTSGGRLLYTTSDQQIWWENEGDPIDLVAISPTASWIVVSRSNPDEDFNNLDFFNQKGESLWTIETEPVINLFLTSEYLEQANIYYTYIEEEIPKVRALNLNGEEVWSFENQTLAAVSRHGSRLAAVKGNQLIVYDSLGYLLWDTILPFEPQKVIFNPQNYNRLLVYGSREGAGENLYYFDLAQDLLWMKRIPDGSLFSFTSDGQHIVTSSWRHFREDYTQMLLLNRDGEEINSWEVAMRVEKLILSGHPYLAVVCGEDGYIDLINLRPLLSESGNGNNETASGPIYNPVTTGLSANQTKIQLYFIDENANLIPVTRTISQTENPIRSAMEELIRGPARGSALYRTIPDKNVYAEVEFSAENGQLSLDMPPELFELNGTIQSASALQSLILTVSAFNEVKEIYLTVRRQPIVSFGDMIIAEQPIQPIRWENPIYTPIMSGYRYYLTIREGATENTDNIDLDNLISQSLRASRSLTFVPSDLNLLGIMQTPEQVQVNLNSSFKEIFPENGSEQDYLRATLILDAIFLTVFENSRSQRVEILIEGDSWAPPAGYPPLSRFYRQPYFINPE